MTVNFNNWKISANYRGDKCWSADGTHQNWNNHNVTVINMENGKRTRFEFWGSIADPELSTEYGVLNAFRMFIEDSLSGEESFRDFCQSFGYDEDSRRAEKTWKACKRAAKKLMRVYGGDIYALLDSLEDYA